MSTYSAVISHLEFFLVILISEIQNGRRIVHAERSHLSTYYFDLFLFEDLMVQQGVDTLLSMGFTNEGNLLTQLLEIHNGDIYKALDVLQVIRK